MRRSHRPLTLAVGRRASSGVGRDALQLKAEGREFSIANFDPESAGILKKIQRELVPHDPNPISAQLYAVNVYTGGGHRTHLAIFDGDSGCIARLQFEVFVSRSGGSS